MKRVGNLYSKICSLENLHLADKKARKGKGSQKGIITFDKNREDNILSLHYDLLNKTFTTSEYTTFKVWDNGKEREIFSLPYRDRIVHHAISNYIEPIFTKTFIADTYSCIKGRGTLKASFALRRALNNDMANTKYALKLDVKKFYPNIDHDILKKQIRRKLKDNELLWLLDNIIDSGPGVPIGNLLSQIFANIYLTSFGRWLKSREGGGRSVPIYLLRRHRYIIKQQERITRIIKPNKGVSTMQFKTNTKVELSNLSCIESWNRFCRICALSYSCEVKETNKEKVCENVS